MDKFKNENPDGLSPDKVFPLAISLKNNTNTWMGSLDWLFGAYGTIQEQWNKDADGNLEYGSINPGAKQALAKLNEWMNKGYIHADSALWDEGKSAESWTAGTAGILPGANWVPDWPAPDLLKNVPGAKYKAYPIPAGTEGKIGTKWQNSGVNASIMINKDAKHPEAIFLYYNYLLDNLANPAAGSDYEYGFAKGYDWDIIDGQPTSDKEKIKDFSNEFPFLTGPARIPDLYMKTLVKLADGEKPETPYEKQMAEFRKPENWPLPKSSCLRSTFANKTTSLAQPHQPWSPNGTCSVSPRWKRSIRSSTANCQSMPSTNSSPTGNLTAEIRSRKK
ncbi:hypothetical protein AB9M62_34465 [Bacillales bacterium AN1005]